MINIGINQANREEIAAGLNQLLADSYSLTKTQLSLERYRPNVH